MNGTTNGDSTIKANDVANNKDQASGKMKDEAGKPSSNLKCLEDPNFSFDDSTATTATTATANPASSESKPSTEAGKKPSYRVLEDPEVNVAKPKTTGYKVGREVKKRNREINVFCIQGAGGPDDDFHLRASQARSCERAARGGFDPINSFFCQSMVLQYFILRLPMVLDNNLTSFSKETKAR